MIRDRLRLRGDRARTLLAMTLPPSSALWALTACFVGADEQAAATDRDGDGWIATGAGGDDCDDSEAAVFPGAEENCIDGVDSDCDGLDCPVRQEWSSTGESAWIVGGSVGGELQLTGAPLDLDGDGELELLVSMPMAEESRGRVVQLPLSDAALSTETDALGEVEGGKEEGLWAHGVGDLDLDGDDEAIVTPLSGTGVVWLVDEALPAASDRAVHEVLPLGISAFEEGETGSFGQAIPLGRYFDDDHGAFALLSAGDSTLHEGGGAVYLFNGAWPEDPSSDVASVAHLAIYGGEAGDALGRGVGGPTDFDGDGNQDLLLIAPGADFVPGGHGTDDDDNTIADVGRVYVLIQPPVDDTTELTDESPYGFTIRGNVEVEGLRSVHGLGDVDGDGYGDLGIHVQTGAGDLAVFFGGSDPRPPQLPVSDAEVRLFGDFDEDPSGGFGERVLGVDVDDDGRHDLLVSAQREFSNEVDGGPIPEAGAAYLFTGPLLGVLGPEHARARWHSEQEGARFGNHPVVSDVDGDGLLDLIVDAPGAPSTDTSQPGWGAIFLIPAAFAGIGG